MLIVLLVCLALLIPSQKVADVAASQFFKTTGRVLRIKGDVSPTVWPVLGVKTGQVQIANADWSREGPMLLAQGLSIGVDVASLFAGDIKITKIEAIRPTIILERGKDGVGNWEIVPDPATASAGQTSQTATHTRLITLDYGTIDNGSVLFVDHASGLRLDIRRINAEARLPDFAGPALLSLSGEKDGVPVTLDGRIATFDAFSAGNISDVTLTARIGGSQIAFDGRIGTAPLVAEGALTADLADMAALAGLAGQTAPALPQGLGAKLRKVSGNVTLEKSGTVHLRGGTIQLDTNTFTGDMDLTYGSARPNLTAKLSSGDLDFSALANGNGTSPANTGTAAAGWSRDLIDVGGLQALDATLALSANTIDFGTAKLNRTRLQITLDNARMVVKALELQAYGGNTTGNFVINGRGGLSVGGDLRMNGIAMQPLLQDVAAYDRLIGTGDVSLKFLGVGNRMSDIMSSLSGAGTLRFGKGELRGLDLVGMLRSLDIGFVGEGQKTIFNAITGSFTLQDGVLRNNDLQFSAPYVAATGSGRVGIGTRDLDYRLVATALAQTDGTGGVTVPLLISGPWTQPKFRLDLKALIDQNLAEEKELLKKKARAEEVRAKAKLEKELGIQRQNGERLEDAAKRRAQEALEDEAARALRKLFGGN